MLALSAMACTGMTRYHCMEQVLLPIPVLLLAIGI